MKAPGGVTIDRRLIVELACPTAAELGLGWERGWISSDDVAAVVRWKDEQGAGISPVERAIMSTPPDRHGDVARLCRDLCVDDQPVELRERLWILLCLAQLLRTTSAPQDELEALVEIFEAFDHPRIMEGLVYWMPAQIGEAVGVGAIVERWTGLVEALSAEYRDRGCGA